MHTKCIPKARLDSMFFCFVGWGVNTESIPGTQAGKQRGSRKVAVETMGSNVILKLNESTKLYCFIKMYLKLDIKWMRRVYGCLFCTFLFILFYFLWYCIPILMVFRFLEFLRLFVFQYFDFYWNCSRFFLKFFFIFTENKNKYFNIYLWNGNETDIIKLV